MRSQYWRTLPAQDFHVFIDEMVKSAAEGKPPVKVRTPSPDTIQGVHYHIELLGDKKQSDYYYRLWKFCVRAEILDPERYPYTDAEDFQARLRI